MITTIILLVAMILTRLFFFYLYLFPSFHFVLKAFDLNRRRLTEEDIATEEIDTIIEGRKRKLRNNTNTNGNSNSSNGNNNKTIWTWDDWFDHIRKKSLEGTTTTITTTTKQGEKQEPGIDVELILEASVPPWELSLHRPELQTYKNNPSKFQLPQAADLIRCMPEDGDEDEEDEYDPSSDGVGSYLDYIYRRFMEEEMRTSPVVTNSHNNTNKDADDIAPMTGTQKRTSWLHCVDVRDLGCQSACRSDSVKEEWKSILTPNEASDLYVADNTSLPSSGNEKKNTKKTAAKITIDPLSGCRSNNNKNNDATANNIMNESNGYVQFVPESRGMNPERIELEKLRSAGKLVKIYDDDDESDDDEDIEEDEFTYPSFEGFFGQNTYVSFFFPCFPNLLQFQLVLYNEKNKYSSS